ncbi:MAG: putative damage-inducible protein DinB [Limisphaerales bacterium]|jgi:uncharacterized damage-inducible protein DinB
MHLPNQLAKHFREVILGGNWTTSNLKDNLEGINKAQATHKISDYNTIASLVFHINYYIEALTKVLNGGPLTANDKYSFDLPEIKTEEDWLKLKEKLFTDSEEFANLVEKMPESRIWEYVSEEKYGTFYKNIHGIIEHTHYHLGQIVIIKKRVLESASN